MAPDGMDLGWVGLMSVCYHERATSSSASPLLLLRFYGSFFLSAFNDDKALRGLYTTHSWRGVFGRWSRGQQGGADPVEGYFRRSEFVRGQHTVED